MPLAAQARQGNPRGMARQGNPLAPSTSKYTRVSLSAVGYDGVAGFAAEEGFLCWAHRAATSRHRQARAPARRCRCSPAAGWHTQ